jgi:hypothetical protein
MTLLKHSVVNANLLAFFCMELCAPDEPSHVTQFTPTDTGSRFPEHHGFQHGDLGAARGKLPGQI